MTERRKSTEADYLVAPAQGARIHVRADEHEDDAVARASHEDPALRERAAALRVRRATRAAAVPEEDVYARLAYAPPSGRPRGPKPKLDQASGRLLVRVPLSVHRQLVTQASEEGVSVNQLVLNYLSRGLGLAGVEASAR